MSLNPSGAGSTRVLVMIASTRPGRLGPAIAEWFLHATEREVQRAGVDVAVADLAQIGLPLLDEPEHPSGGSYTHEHTRDWSRRVSTADAFVIVTPEYNYGMPAALKNAIDFLYHEWAWKPVCFVSYGNTSAGTRSVQMAKQVVTTVRMVPIGATVALRIADSIDEHGRVRETDGLNTAARQVLDELTRVAQALRPLRSRNENSAPIGATRASGTAGHESVLAGPRSELSLAIADETDVPELLVLQRCCWISEALANDTLDLAPLHESLQDVRSWANTWRVWCVRRHGRLVAAVRARADGTVWHIGRLMVAPDLAGQGIGRWLLDHAEAQAPAGTTECALFTGSRSLRNIALYQRAGYAITDAPVGRGQRTASISRSAAARPRDAVAAHAGSPEAPEG